MPLTPLHILAFLWVYFLTHRRIDPTALILSTSLIDLEALAGIYLKMPHWVWHSYFGAIVFSIPLALFLYLFEHRANGFLTRTYGAFSVPFQGRPYGFRMVYITYALGSTSHVFLDSLTHRSFPLVFFPFVTSPNPFWFGFEFAWMVYAILVLLSVYSLVLWIKSSSKA